MTLQQKNHRGFTLLELIITVAIMMVVVGGSIAGFVSFTDRQEVLNTAKEVQQMMRNAQSKARVREVPNIAGCITLEKYRVQYNGSSTFILQAGCKNATGTDVFGSGMRTITLPTGVSVTPSGARSIDFSTLEEGVSGGTTFTFTKGSNVFQFTVSASGSISNIIPTPP